MHAEIQHAPPQLQPTDRLAGVGALSYILLSRHGPPGHGHTLPLTCLSSLTHTNTPRPFTEPAHPHIPAENFQSGAEMLQSDVRLFFTLNLYGASLWAFMDKTIQQVQLLCPGS